MHDFTALAAQVGRAVSPIVAHSPGQRPGGTLTAIDTFGIFAPAQKCHAPKARNPLMPLTPNGALPLIRKAALTERDTLINATSLPRALPGAMCNNWAFSPPHLCSQHSEHGACTAFCNRHLTHNSTNWSIYNAPFLDIFFEIFCCARHSPFRAPLSAR